jgi:hypothetical protein
MKTLRALFAVLLLAGFGLAQNAPSGRGAAPLCIPPAGKVFGGRKAQLREAESDRETPLRATCP